MKSERNARVESVEFEYGVRVWRELEREKGEGVRSEKESWKGRRESKGEL